MYPKRVGHWIQDRTMFSPRHFFTYCPTTGKKLASVSRGGQQDVDRAVQVAKRTLDAWKGTNIVFRSEIIRRSAMLMAEKKDELVSRISLETGKSKKDAAGEVNAAIEMGFFVAGEGRRFYGKTSTSAVADRSAMTIRQPIGICGLITPANTPIANIAWKVFPALVCGNTVILKPPENAPDTAMWFAKIMKRAGLPSGVLSIVQGLGEEAGMAIVEHDEVRLISFTGSVAVGKRIQEKAGSRLAKVCLELGGKNPLIVCDDADLDIAVRDAVLSAFSNAGQRCAAGSRIIVFSRVYETFKKKFLRATKKLRIGSSDTDDFGPVINERQMKRILSIIQSAVKQKTAKLICGKTNYRHPVHPSGYFVPPTIFEISERESPLWNEEVFGPVTMLCPVKNFAEAVRAANDSPFALTASIHTASIHRAQEFIQKCEAGVVYVNGPTYGSEPHMPFGGLKNSGNGFREAGTEALDVYSELKTVYVKHFSQSL